MADKLKTEIVSPERLLLSEEAESVSIPGALGYLTIMANHAPTLTILKQGFVTVNAAQKHMFYVQGGFADITPHGLTILAELSKPVEDFSRAEIDAQVTKAKEALAKEKTPEGVSAAQAVLDGWNNLILEAENLGPDVKLL